MKTIKVRYWGDRPKNFTGIAIDMDGDKAWLQNGQFHRIDGPAVEWLDGEKHYYVLNQRLTKNQFQIFQFMWGTTLLEHTDELMKIFVKLVRIQK